METDRVTADAPSLGVTTIGSHSHIGSQVLGEDRRRLVDVFLWQLFSDGLLGDFQLISRLRLQLKFMGFSWSSWYFLVVASWRCR